MKKLVMDENPPHAISSGWRKHNVTAEAIEQLMAGKNDMTPDRESRIEAALAALLAEVVSMREDYPAEAWRFSDEVIAEAEAAMDMPKQG